MAMRYTKIKKALNMLANDQGLSRHPVDVPTLRKHGLSIASERWDGDVDLDTVECCLARLTDAELETLCIGDAEDHPALLRKVSRGQKTRNMVNAFLEEMFEQTGD